MRTHLLTLCALVAYLVSGCSQNDYDTDSVNPNNTSSGSMSISASLPSSTTKVTETADATKGLITAWENNDVLQVFHKYTNNSTVGAMQAFNFTSTAAGSSTTFTYTGAGEYAFTSGNSLYGFNILPTASNYTQTYNSTDENFTLSLGGYASQDGTVSNLGNYDAMYGVSSVNAEGTPAAMGMNHLMSVLRFDLTNENFTDATTNVTFAYTASTGSSLLPASGSFTLSNTGTVTTGILTGTTSWTVSNVDASSGTASVYLMTFPDTRSGTLTITASPSNGGTYYRTITLSGLSLTSGSMKAYKVTLNGYFYMWDAATEYAVYNNNYNTITSGVATNSCKNCPTLNQIQMYLGAGTYWDKTTSWKDASGTTRTGGLWLKRKAYISGFDAGTATKKASTTPTNGVPTDTSKYFFLPANGCMDGNRWQGVGSGGYYWSSTPTSSTTTAYALDFGEGSAITYTNGRSLGFNVWLLK